MWTVADIWERLYPLPKLPLPLSWPENGIIVVPILGKLFTFHNLFLLSLTADHCDWHAGRGTLAYPSHIPQPHWPCQWSHGAAVKFPLFLLHVAGSWYRSPFHRLSLTVTTDQYGSSMRLL